MDCGASRRANLDIPAITAAAPAIATPLIIKARSGAGCSDPSHSHTTRVYQDREAALRFLEPLGRQIYASGLGTLSEIFDGDAPFTPRGGIAQAWTVAEVLRAWKKIADEKKPATS